jgi:hypothetical protein
MSFSGVGLQEKCAYYANGFDNMLNLAYLAVKTRLRFLNSNGIFPEI